VSSGQTKLTLHPRLIVTKRKDLSCFVKCRQFVRLNGVSPPVDIKPFNNCIDTLERAVNERVFFVKNREGKFVEPPKPEHNHFTTTMSGVGIALKKSLSKTVPLTRRQFVDTFRGRKRAIYERAFDSLLTRGVDQKDANIQVFVKCEKTDHTTKVDPVPRVISPRSSRYNVEVGRYLRKIEKPIFEALGKLFGHTTVIKGVDAVKSAHLLSEKWGMFTHPVAIGLDASRFDQHVSKEALMYEHDVYVNCFGYARNRTQLARYLSMQLENNCSGYCPDGKLKYRTDGGRMSGDMNTSLGNCLIMVSLIKAYLTQKNINGQLANNGDDCVVFMEKSQVANFQEGLFEWFEKMGFHMTMEQPVYDFEQIEFCQTKPVLKGDGQYIMCRKPQTTLAKDVVLMDPFQTVNKTREWLDAVGEGGLSLTGSLPIFQEFYSALIRSGIKPTKAFKTSGNGELFSWGYTKLIGGLHHRYQEVTTASRASFFYAFGVTPDEQIDLERFYENLTIDVSTLDKGLEATYKHDFPF
jgi:hypothetical protein